MPRSSPRPSVNVNDNVSFLNVADGATAQLKGVLFRLRELATQSFNGVLYDVQRASLDKEAQALQAEYNRVIETSKFNGVSVFNGAISIQAGSGEGAVLTVGVGTSSSGIVFGGDGTLTLGMSFPVGNVPSSVVAADFNGDGVLDLVTSDSGSSNASVLLGNGDGTFKARLTVTTGSLPQQVAVADFNGDGVSDLVSVELIGRVGITLVTVMERFEHEPPFKPAPLRAQR